MASQRGGAATKSLALVNPCLERVYWSRSAAPCRALRAGENVWKLFREGKHSNDCLAKGKWKPGRMRILNREIGEPRDIE